MKLLFDEHLSPRLCSLLVDLFPGSENVLLTGLGGRTDEEIGSYAAASNFTIVSKDADLSIA
jgi:predicted nuclease of predicted toxin-antitoxin system